MNLSGKKIVVLVERDYQDLEVWYPLLRLREEGADVTQGSSATRSKSPPRRRKSIRTTLMLSSFLAVGRRIICDDTPQLSSW
jgi:putative intracellular protease/amidase